MVERAWELIPFLVAFGLSLLSSLTFGLELFWEPTAGRKISLGSARKLDPVSVRWKTLKMTPFTILLPTPLFISRWSRPDSHAWRTSILQFSVERWKCCPLLNVLLEIAFSRSVAVSLHSDPRIHSASCNVNVAYIYSWNWDLCSWGLLTKYVLYICTIARGEPLDTPNWRVAIIGIILDTQFSTFKKLFSKHLQTAVSKFSIVWRDISESLTTTKFSPYSINVYL